jgi:ABC-type nitrate/sulfonate/bicarbonate transport system permease component
VTFLLPRAEARVGFGYFLAVIVAIPPGFLIGMSPLMARLVPTIDVFVT